MKFIKRVVEVGFILSSYPMLRCLEMVGTLKATSEEQKREDWIEFKKLLREAAAGRLGSFYPNL